MAVLGSTTVFVPSPMYPDFRPQMVQVGAFQQALGNLLQDVRER